MLAPRAASIDASTPKKNGSRLSALSALLLALAITVGSLGPFQFRYDYAGFLNHRIITLGPLNLTPHALIHIISFGALAFLTWLSSGQRVPRLMGTLAILCLAIAIEWLQQRQHPHNRLEVWDLCSDALGVCLGVAVALPSLVRRAATPRE